MLSWAQQAVYYHIVIDRFATSRQQFQCRNHRDYDAHLCDWMGGTLQGIAESLDYLQNLGIDALILTPFFQGKKYHGYWITDFFRVDPHFGDVAALRQLIDAAHQRSMRVIMDLPITHCHRDARLARTACEQPAVKAHWLCRDETGEVMGFYGDPQLPELNLDHVEVTRFVNGVIDYWLPLGFDGIRFDHAKRPSNCFWRSLAAGLRHKYPHLLLLGENWRESGEIGALSPYIHGELNIALAGALRQFAQQPTVRSLQTILQRVTDQRPLRNVDYVLPLFLDNHDMERISTVANNAHAHIALAYFVMLTLPYPCIIYYGSESAQTQSDNLPLHHYERDRYFREPMAWSKQHTLTAWIERLISLRREYQPWFKTNPEAVASPATGLIAYRYTHLESAITMVLNLQPHAAEIALAATQTELLISINGGAIHHGTLVPHLALNAHSGVIVRHPADEQCVSLTSRQEEQNAKVMAYAPRK